MLDLRDLKAFVALGETLHFRLAAERLHMTPSALSKQIQRLELSFGGPLFERSRSATRLTSLGRTLLPEATALLERANQLALRGRQAAQGILGSLRIGFGVTSQSIAPRAIARFRELRPEVQISLHEMSTRHQHQAMLDGALDVGFCRLPAPAGWPTLAVLTESLVALVPQSYPSGVSPAALSQHLLVTIDRARAPAFHDHVIRFLAQRQMQAAAMQTVNDFSAAAALAAAGVGWAVVPASFARHYEGARIVSFDDPAAEWQVGLVRPAGGSDELVSVFWQVVAEMSSLPGDLSA